MAKRSVLLAALFLVGCGSQGAAGAPGTNGATGPSGETGATGPTGPSGVVIVAAGDGGTAIPGLVNVTSLGAVGDGTTDNTAVLTAAVVAYPALYFPAGTYLTDTVTLPDNAYILAAPGAVLLGKSGTLVDQNHPVLAIGSNTRIDGLAIDGNAANRVNDADGGVSPACFRMVNASSVDLHAVNAYNCAGDGVTVQSTTNYVIEASQVADAGNGAIDIVASNLGRVSDSYVENCADGILWWGGNSGAVNASPGLSDLTIEGNSVQNITSGGCIWGSSGDRVTVSANTVENCGDVGIDFEGTNDSSATGNTVLNTKNGGITFFYSSSNLAISGNTINAPQGSGPGIGFYDDGLCGDQKTFCPPSTNITVSGNDITTDGAYAIVTDGASNNPAGANNDVSIADNTITATSTAIFLSDTNYASAEGNRITVSGPTAIDLGGSNYATVADNIITTTSDNSTGNGNWGGIYMPWESASYPTQYNDIHGNTISGFEISIEDDCWGNTATGDLIENNRVSGMIVQWTGGTGVVAGNTLLDNPSQPVGATQATW
jgi:parallel beta-helix repeat protein